MHGCGSGGASPVGGILWSLHALQLFFCTGHFCEFAGLQYTAGALRVTRMALSRLPRYGAG